MKKILLSIKSILIYIFIKIRYGKRICIHPINSLKGIFKVDISKESSCKIGKFLMICGPLYVKVSRGGCLEIGEEVFFNHNCSITCIDSVKIGRHCMFANNLVIVDHNHKFDSQGVGSELISKPVVIEDNVWCGANVTIISGVRIGAGAVIGANSVVTTDIPAHAMAAGTPAKVKNYL